MLAPTVIFPWNANFETGIAKIDEQHQRLVDLLNQLAAQLACGENTQLLSRVFDELIDYTVYHFKTEEDIWNEFLPADDMSEEHQQTHQQFVDEVLKLKLAQDTLSNNEVVDEVISFLTHWLAFHILEADKRMAKIVLFLQQGLSLQAAKERAGAAMNGATRVLIDTVLSMYDAMSARTLQLMREITQRERVEERLRLSKSVIDTTMEAVFITDAQNMVIDTNPAFCQDVGLTHEQIVGMNIKQVKPSLCSQGKTIWHSAAINGHWAGELLGKNNRGEAEPVWLALSVIKNQQGVVSHYVGLLSSMSKLLERQHSLEKIAHHDALTGLLNRHMLDDRLNQAITHSNRTGRCHSVCYLDLDGFKQINDNFGHEAGDEVLRSVAARLNQHLRGEDTVLRLGGDEFVLLLGDLETEEDAHLLLNRLLLDIAEPIQVEGLAVQVTASIGVALYPRDQSSAEQLLQHADQAMYIAKHNGKSRYHIYGEQMSTEY